jgi:hypothetical protein
MPVRLLPLLAFALLAPAAHAAASAQPVTPLNTSVLGGERQVYSARFFDPLGRPSVGERVRFANDACGSFENGGFSIEALTDATGTASATFTARPQGITCWVTATAGVAVRFNVFTYTLGQVTLAASMSPAEPRPGQAFTIIAGAYAGAYPIYGADVTARIVGGTGLAGISPATASTGQAGRAEFGVVPGVPLADYEIEIGYRGLVKRVAVAAPESPLQDMWWSGPAENGWGLSVVQHGDRLFSVVYAYDAAGKPTWYVMPGGEWNAARTLYSGTFYAPRGTPWSAYDASRLEVREPVGGGAISFEGLDSARLALALEGSRVSKALTRQRFGVSSDVAAPVAAGDMWWGGPAQNGWGIAILQQHATLFAVWFTYDEAGAPTWFVMPAGFWRDASTWEGRIYRTTGSPWPGAPYDPAALRSFDVGTFSMRFAGDRATFAYTIEGRSGTLPLERQPF